MLGFYCCFLTCIQVSREASKVVWYSHLLRIFHNYLWSTAKGFSVVNEAKVDVFLEFPCFLYDPTDVGNLIFSSSTFSKSSLYTWKFLVDVLLKPSLENIQNYFASVWNKCNCVVVWTFSGIALLCDWNGNQPFPVEKDVSPQSEAQAYLALAANVKLMKLWQDVTGIKE